jgi:hypothetical protein
VHVPDYRDGVSLTIASTDYRKEPIGATWG